MSIPLFSIKLVDLRNNQKETIQINDVHEFTFIKSIRNNLSKILRRSPDNIVLLHPNNPSHRHIELTDDQTLHDLHIFEEGFLQYSIKSSSPITISGSLSNSNLLTINMPSPHDSNNSLLISPATEGTSGVYFVENLLNHRKSAVFKPFDEEQGMANNPKGFTNAPLKSNFKPGQGIIREYAAYILDFKNFCKIPKTQLTRLEDESFRYKTDSYPKLGALQEFVQDSEEISSYGLNLFSDFEVQKIALLDIRLLNCDRNDQNVLVVKRQKQVSSFTEGDLELIPIDHAYCLPPQLYIESWDWFWFNYPQLKRPVCPEIIQYMNELNIDELLDDLSREVVLSPHCLFLIRIVHFLILKCLNSGLTLFQIASIVARVDTSVPSPLEKIITEAETNSYCTIEARSGRLISHSQPNDSCDFNTRERSHSNLSTSNTFYAKFKNSTESFISDLTNSVNISPSKLVSNSVDSTTVLPKLDVPIRARSSESYLISSSSTVKSISRSFDGYKSLNSALNTNNSGLSEDNWEISFNLSTNSFSRNVLSDNKSVYQTSPDTTDSDFSDDMSLSISPSNSNNDSLVHGNDIIRNSINSITSTDTSNDTYDSHNQFLKGSSRRNSFAESSDSLYVSSHLSQKPSESLSLRRMVSFAAAGSAPMYDYNTFYEDRLNDTSKIVNEPLDIISGYRVPKRIMRQHNLHESLEFQSLRLHFAKTLLTFLVKKISS